MIGLAILGSLAIAGAIGKAAANFMGTKKQIAEAHADYSQAIEDTQAQKDEADAEAARLEQQAVEAKNFQSDQMMDSFIEGSENMEAEGRYAVGNTAMQGALNKSAGEAAMGASGLKRAGSPLLALQQNAKMQDDALREQQRGVDSTMRMTGSNLSQGMGMLDFNLEQNRENIAANNSLLTAGYQRQMDEFGRKRKGFTGKNKRRMLGYSLLGGLSDIASTTAQVGMNAGWGT
jgi:hypothetical protein